MLGILISLHVLSAVIWVGGMLFAYTCLRPVAASTLEPGPRLTLWSQVFKRFFVWVWHAVVILLVTGHWMMGAYGIKGMHVMAMMGLAYVMFALFVYVYFFLYKHLRQEVENQNWPLAASWLNKIRQIIAANLALGLVVVVVASGGRYLF